MRVANVNFLRGVVHRAQQWPDKPLKTDGSAQPIPIPQDLALLHVHRTPFAGARLVRSSANLSGWAIRSKSIFVTPFTFAAHEDVGFVLSVRNSCSSRSV
jgi:hypothetical protein